MGPPPAVSICPQSAAPAFTFGAAGVQSAALSFCAAPAFCSAPAFGAGLGVTLAQRRRAQRLHPAQVLAQQEDGSSLEQLTTAFGASVAPASSGFAFGAAPAPEFVLSCQGFPCCSGQHIPFELAILEFGRSRVPNLSTMHQVNDMVQCVHCVASIQVFLEPLGHGIVKCPLLYDCH